MWKELLNASINAFAPFVEKYKANKNPIDNKPPLGLFIISWMVLNAASLVDGGNIDPNILINVSWNPDIGIYGISVNRKIIAGKNARKKLNARDDARVLMDPLWIPSQKNIATS